jgi:hypothetical protein
VIFEERSEDSCFIIKEENIPDNGKRKRQRPRGINMLDVSIY